MKRITLTFLAVFLSTAFAMAQTQVGLKAGYNLANISDGDTFGGNFGDDANFGDYTLSFPLGEVIINRLPGRVFTA